jgi:adenylate kinase family enzyme
VHFDFGSRLRAAARPGQRHELLAADDLNIIRDVLQRGVLLEDQQFHVAGKILGEFIKDTDADEETLVVLNGLPRHAGQAEGVAASVQVVAVIVLECAAEVVLERIRRDTGGDRAERNDDAEVEVRRRLQIYDERTAPLIDYYESRGVRVVRVAVGVETVPSDLIGELAAQAPTN